MTRDPRPSRTLRRRLLRELGSPVIRVESLGAHELRGLRRVRLRDLERPEPQPLPDRVIESEAQEPTGPTVTAVHWIEIVLVGEDDRPIPGELYEIELPDGRVRRGRLDSEGKARIDGLRQAGACKVSFPNLDQDAWQPL